MNKMRPFCYLPLALVTFPLQLSALPDREREAPHLPPAVAQECYREAGERMDRLREEWSGCRFMIDGRELLGQWDGPRTFLR
ncbi:MAG: hypothetical protein LBF24_00185, partial [Puniceicoccales bacterium]|nr:hypothetical protein [Puniceicoccales bacterium]